ncbi:mitochondrial import inner membrane translocase subunit TIM14 [Paramarasmius palmivorus]|uniref:Mitochondrial import inner membrane translocase subunit TIM14 n=1 Tax=Paramarasmius palmivorus TaxID=297713 RepID=A0AAW0DE14_9AGAR
MPDLGDYALIGFGAVATVFVGRRMLSRGAKGPAEWAKGGFKSKMDRNEALSVLGLKDGPKIRNQLKDAHRQIMLANHPDRGGSPYLASKINEAKDLIEKQDKRR